MNETPSLEALRNALTAYAPVSDATWAAFKGICTPIHLKKGDHFCRAGDFPTFFGFVHSGLLRAYVSDQNGNEYNTIFFPEKTFPGSMVALLTSSASKFAIEALEASQLLKINFQGYRKLLINNDDLKLFHIRYLEKNWLIGQEAREVMLVQEDATARY
ncbi:MAG: cyclic nucleotide-binding domain-containing protein, partial [Nitrospirota bacterium]|nr:cyclic nucleotide-binding domain-containing protein [Nitrospirota bacterium]